jgi:hypothetical protein
MIDIPSHADDRGTLTALEAGSDPSADVPFDVPFDIKRIFLVHRVKPPYERGEHAHPDTEQILMCVAGTMRVDLFNGVESRTFALDDPCRGLYVPEMIWTRLYDFTPDAVCMAAASTHYVPAKVIRDRDTYIRLARGQA